MKKQQFIYFSILFTTLFSACKKDNYDSPNAGISGVIVDELTGNNVAQQTLNGAKISLFQTSYATNPTPINSSLNSDGTFNNANIFNGTYKIVAQGPFLYTDTISRSIEGHVQQTIKVKQYLNVTCTLVSKTSTSITVQVKVKKDYANDQQIARVGVIAGLTKNLDVNNYYNLNNSGNGRILTNTESISNSTVESTTYNYTMTSLKPGTLYYIRGLGRTINNGNFFNYAPMFEVTTASN